MFTDIVGYTALMSKDEENALRILQKNRDVVKLFVGQFNGELLKEMGDGNLCSFPSVVDAVNCALEIQKSLKDESDFKLRIGVHLGDVVVEEGGDVFGDGVNVASRIENLAEPGGICVSERVYHDIRNKPNIDAVSLGEKSLKNVSHPLKIYCVKTGAESARGAQIIKTTEAIPKSSIAVLPFVNMSADPEQEYFCDGITEEIINALTHVEDLKVIARTSAFAFKGKNDDIREIGSKLGVNSLLEGSVRKAGNMLRITAQLINVEDATHLFSESFDREIKDVFEIQDEISLAIVKALKVKLLKKEKAAIVKRYTEDLEAYNLYLKGNYYWQMLIKEGFDKAIDHFERAIRKDPQYALAYTGLASVYWINSYWGIVPPNKSYPMAKEYAKKALKIDNTLSEAHTTLGAIYKDFDWNFKAAERELKQALQLNANSPFIHLHYSQFLTFNGCHDEAIIEAKRARELDPLSTFMNGIFGNALNYGRQYDRAIEALQTTTSMNPNFHFPYYFLGTSYWGKSMLKEATTAYEKAVELSGGAAKPMASLIAIYYKTGKKAKADKLFDSLTQRSKEEYIPPICFYQIYKAQGNQEKALEYIKQACKDHDSYLLWYRVHPLKEYRISDDPWIKKLWKKRS
ncbi:adenylate/guanylate cyclase domain-containing protein [Candidatus Latescibacterota bacterium]